MKGATRIDILLNSDFFLAYTYVSAMNTP